MVTKYHEYKNIKIVTFPKLTELGLVNLFTTSSQNFRYHGKEDIPYFKENYALLKEFMGFPDKLMISTDQVHSNNVEYCKDENYGEEYPFGRVADQIDGLITSNPDLILKSTFADCTPVLLFDPVTKTQASLHSGWRGTVSRISKNAIEIMKKEKNVNPENIIAVIGPSLNQENFEIQMDVVEKFQNEFSFADKVIKQKNEIKYLLNIKEANRLSLLEYGLKPENIYVCEEDTFNNENFHSYRGQGPEKAGRMIMMSYIKK